jgi:predicted nucleic acid-binding protein
MERWIINASPLILLGKIGRLDILEQLNPAYTIPLAVAEELDAGLVTHLKPELIRLVQSGSLLSGAIIDEALRLAGE